MNEPATRGSPARVPLDPLRSSTVGYRYSPRVRRLLASLAPVICPEGATRLGLIDWLVDHTELTVGSFPPVVRRALVAGLTTYDLAAAAWPRARGRTAGKLDPEQAAAWFASWWESRLGPRRQLARAVKQLFGMAYYEAPAVQAELGYAPQAWIGTVARRRLAVHREAIDRHDASLLAPDPLPSPAARRAREAR